MLGEHCAHRGTSLFFGRNEECGLRCIYHGWKYDVDGNVLETPAEPGDSDFGKKLRHTAYPTHEANGVIYAYLGPRDKMPLFPNYEWTQVPLESILRHQVSVGVQLSPGSRRRVRFVASFVSPSRFTNETQPAALQKRHLAGL